MQLDGGQEGAGSYVGGDNDEMLGLASHAVVAWGSTGEDCVKMMTAMAMPNS